MNSLLYKERNDLIGSEHISAMRLVMNELVIKSNERIDEDKYCANCSSNYSVEQYSTYIFWHKFEFCGEWCKYNGEGEMRKSYMRSLQNAAH